MMSTVVGAVLDDCVVVDTSSSVVDGIGAGVVASVVVRAVVLDVTGASVDRA